MPRFIGPDATRFLRTIVQRNFPVARLTRRPSRICAATAVLRAERTRTREFVRRVDRSLRTLTARRIAAEACSWASAQSLVSGSETLVQSLAGRASWMDLGGRQLACAFGRRRAIVTLPAVRNVAELASMIARTEVRIMLGDAPQAVVSDLQAFAERELQHCFAMHHLPSA